MKKLVLGLLLVFLVSSAYAAETTVTRDTSYVDEWRTPTGGVIYHIAFPCTSVAVEDSFTTWVIDLEPYKSVGVSFWTDSGTVWQDCSLKIGYEQSFEPLDSTFTTPYSHTTIANPYVDSVVTDRTVLEVFSSMARFIRFYVYPLAGHDITPDGKFHFYIYLSKSPISFFRQGGVGRFSRAVFPSPSSSIEYYHIKLAPTGDTLFIEADVDALLKFNYVEADSVNILQGLDFDGANIRTQRHVDVGTNTNLGDQTFGGGGLTAGGYNSAFGNKGLYSITSGTNNCSFGNEVLYNLTTGTNNLGINSFAGKLITTGSHNINIGYKSGYALTTTDNNINIGSYSNYVGTGSKNIIIGYNIDLPTDAGDNQLNIGNLIYGTGLDGVDKAVSAGKVGIGIDSPAEALDVNGSVKASGDIYSVVWTDYAGTSTLVGWSGTPVKNIWYKKVGNLVFVSFYINGTSNSTTTTFTLPYTNNDNTNAEVDAAIRLWNNGVNSATSGQINLPKNSNIVTCFIDWAAGAFTNANAKVVIGQFWYEAQ